MNWSTAEATLKSYIETGWAASPHAAIPLVFENSLDDPAETMVAVAIEGIYGEKCLYGSVGKRCSLETGIVFYHAFVAIGDGKVNALSMIETMSGLLELQSIAPGLNMDGANPPSPVEFRMSDRGIPTGQPNGNYWRCSGSVPFILIDTR